MLPVFSFQEGVMEQSGRSAAFAPARGRCRRSSDLPTHSSHHPCDAGLLHHEGLATEKPGVGVEDGGLVLFCDDALADFALASHCLCLWRYCIGGHRVQAVLAASRHNGSKPWPPRHRGEPGQQQSQGPVKFPAGTRPTSVGGRRSRCGTRPSRCGNSSSEPWSSTRFSWCSCASRENG